MRSSCVFGCLLVVLLGCQLGSCISSRCICSHLGECYDSLWESLDNIQEGITELYVNGSCLGVEKDVGTRYKELQGQAVLLIGSNPEASLLFRSPVAMRVLGMLKVEGVTLKTDDVLEATRVCWRHRGSNHTDENTDRVHILIGDEQKKERSYYPSATFTYERYSRVRSVVDGKFDIDVEINGLISVFGADFRGDVRIETVGDDAVKGLVNAFSDCTFTADSLGKPEGYFIKMRGRRGLYMTDCLFEGTKGSYIDVCLHGSDVSIENSKFVLPQQWEDSPIKLASCRSSPLEREAIDKVGKISINRVKFYQESDGAALELPIVKLNLQGTGPNVEIGMVDYSGLRAPVIDGKAFHFTLGKLTNEGVVEEYTGTVVSSVKQRYRSVSNASGDKAATFVCPEGGVYKAFDLIGPRENIRQNKLMAKVTVDQAKVTYGCGDNGITKESG